MTATHTPGPWSTNGGTLVYGADGGNYIASVNYRGSNARTRADVRLITVAPLLLKMCGQLLDELADGRRQVSGETHDLAAEAWRQATTV